MTALSFEDFIPGGRLELHFRKTELFLSFYDSLSSVVDSMNTLSRLISAPMGISEEATMYTLISESTLAPFIITIIEANTLRTSNPSLSKLEAWDHASAETSRLIDLIRDPSYVSQSAPQ